MAESNNGTDCNGHIAARAIFTNLELKTKPGTVASRRVKKTSLIILPFATALVILAIVALCTKLPQIPGSIPSNLSNEPFELGSLQLPDQDLRLPRTVRPFHYKLNMVPFLENDTAAGSVSILTTCVEANVYNITLHAKNITILKSAVATVDLSVGPDSDEADSGLRWRFMDIVRVTHDTERNFLILHFQEPLMTGYPYQIHFEFVSTIRSDLKGLYKSTYIDKMNHTKSLAVTQFEPISARLAFPCFDEPDLKATFELSVGRKVGMSSISNTERNSTESMLGAPDWVWDHYNLTPLMSTYLLAFVVSEFQHTETTFSSGPSELEKSLRVWSRPEYINQTDFALRIAPKLVEFFESFLDTEYAMQKLDLVAIPDFGHGGMENFGMITFKEWDLLLVESETPRAVVDAVASTIAHEISHQWFGDLVTMKWWSDLWLNEGFATYLQYVGVNHVEPSWNKMTNFHSSEVYPAFQTDSLLSSHPISLTVDNLDGIREMFDTITYSKGAAVIRMMAHFLNETTFQKGLQRYLQKWQFSNTEPDDLWQVMTAQGHEDGTLDQDMSVQQIMSGWATQEGFPVVQVERRQSQSSEGGGIALLLFTQTQFRANGPSVNQLPGQIDTTSNRWWVPISYATPSVNFDFSITQPLFWLSPDVDQYTTEITLNILPTEWMVVNVHQTGFYRVNYDTNTWHLLASQLHSDPSDIAVENRGQLIDDAFNLARASMLPYDLAFSLADYLQNGSEPEFLPWKAYADSILFFQSMFESGMPEQLYNLHAYMRLIIQQQFTQLGFYDQSMDTIPTTQTRTTVVSLACMAGNSICVNNSRNLFWRWMKETSMNNPVPLNYRKAIYCTAVKYGGDGEWNFLLKQYLQHSVPSERKVIVHGLSCSRNGDLLSSLLEMALDPGSEIRRGEAAYVLREIASMGPTGTKLVLGTLVQKWTFVVNYLPAMDKIMDVIGQRLNTLDALKQVQTLKMEHRMGIGAPARALNQALERIQGNIDWMQVHLPEVVQLLQDNGPNPNNGATHADNKYFNDDFGTATDMILLQ